MFGVSDAAQASTRDLVILVVTEPGSTRRRYWPAPRREHEPVRSEQHFDFAGYQ
jgi:hypothetical protein